MSTLLETRYAGNLVLLRDGCDVVAAGGLGEAIHQQLIERGVQDVVAKTEAVASETTANEEE